MAPNPNSSGPVWLLSLGLLLLAIGGLLGCAPSGGNLSETRPVGPDGTVVIDFELGRSLSFDQGSLEVRSHPAAGEVRFEVETVGWGGYAVDVALVARGGDVELRGRVDGTLYWLFGGPTVNVRVWVPVGASVHARLGGGPIRLMDLEGPVTARVEADDIDLSRARGRVELVSTRGQLRVVDVEGALSVESGEGGVEITGVIGPVHARTETGSVHIENVDGSVLVETARGRVEIDEVAGAIRAVSRDGHIEIDEAGGEVFAESGRGRIDVEFAVAPRGQIRSKRGDVRVEYPEGTGFDLDVAASKGCLDLDGDAAYAALSEVADEAPWTPWIELAEKWGDRVRNGASSHEDQGAWYGEWREAWDAHRERWRAHREARREQWKNHEPPWRRRDASRAFEAQAAYDGPVNGGGPDLVVRSESGHITLSGS